MLLTILGMLPSDSLSVGGIFLVVHGGIPKVLDSFNSSLLFHLEQLAVKKLRKIWNISIFTTNQPIN
jgi:hypothetical protein